MHLPLLIFSGRLTAIACQLITGVNMTVQQLLCEKSCPSTVWTSGTVGTTHYHMLISLEEHFIVTVLCGISNA